MGVCSGYYSRWTLPSLLWSALSLLSAALCSLGLYFSNWLQRETPDGTYNSASSYRLCLNQTSQLSASCDSYFTFSEIYSTEWRAVTLMMGLGACILTFIALISVSVLCIHRFCNKYLLCVVTVLQSLGVILFVVAALLFPAGIANDMVQHSDLCGPDAASFNLGKCSIGWAYITLIVGTSLGLVAVLLSWTPAMWNRKNNDGAP